MIYAVKYYELYIMLYDFHRSTKKITFKTRVLGGDFGDTEAEENIVELEDFVRYSNFFTIRRNQIKPEEIGNGISQLMLKGGVGKLFETARRDADKKPGNKLRIKLLIPDKELAAVPWELSCIDDEYLTVNLDISIVRKIGSVNSELTKRESLSGVVAIARLAPKFERRIIQNEENAINAWQKQMAEWEKLVKADPRKDIIDWKYPLLKPATKDLVPIVADIFHFVGHGDEKTIHLRGKNKMVPASKLIPFLISAEVQLAVLGSCFSGIINKELKHGVELEGLAIELLQANIPAVIAMQELIDFRAFEHFTESFYDCLADRMPLDLAVSKGRLAIYEKYTDEKDPNTRGEWAIPVFYLNSSDSILLIDSRKSIIDKIIQVIKKEEHNELPSIKRYVEVFGLDFLEELVKRMSEEITPDIKEMSSRLGQGNFLQAMSEIESLLLKKAEIMVNPETLYYLGGVSADYGQYEVALKCFQMAVDAMEFKEYREYNDAFDAIAKIQIHRAQQDLNEGYRYESKKKLREALNATFRMGKRKSRALAYRGIIFDLMANVANNYAEKFQKEEKEHIENACKICRRLQEKDLDAESLYDLGNLFHELSKLDDAICYYNKAITAKEDHLRAWHHLALAYESKMVKEKDPGLKDKCCKKALEAWKKALELAKKKKEKDKINQSIKQLQQVCE